MVMHTGRLIAASCTTGWADWIHGELWLLPDGILRARTSLRRTVANGARPIPEADKSTRTFSVAELAAVKQAHRTNRSIPAESISSASLRRGLMTTRLALRLVDGTRIKLLWVKGEPADTEVPLALATWGISL